MEVASSPGGWAGPLTALLVFLVLAGCAQLLPRGATLASAWRSLRTPVAMFVTLAFVGTPWQVCLMVSLVVWIAISAARVEQRRRRTHPVVLAIGVVVVTALMSTACAAAIYWWWFHWALYP